MIKERIQGIRFNNIRPQRLTRGKNGITEADLLVHGSHLPPTPADCLSWMRKPGFLVAMGVFRAVEASTYNEQIHAQVDSVKAKKGQGDLRKAQFPGNMWEVK